MEIQNVERAASPKVNCEAMGSNPTSRATNIISYFLNSNKLEELQGLQRASNHYSYAFLRVEME